VHGATAITAVTAQNTTAVSASAPLPPDLVVAQVEAVVADLPVAAVKTGMLATSEIVAAVARLAESGRLPRLVVDPVLVSSTGHLLLEEGGVDAYRRLLLPLGLVVTPNLREAAVLTGRSTEQLDTVEAMADAARELQSLGATYVVVKGGHLERAKEERARHSPEHAHWNRPDGDNRAGAPDVVAGPSGTVVLEGVRVATANDHGTGCSLSAAIAANLALGADPMDAVTQAKHFVRRALEGASRWQLGSGHGPIDHLGWSDRQASPEVSRAPRDPTLNA
jgi:hydroxymethylpyrimidine/phosphomethylpyrimidine kinase